MRIIYLLIALMIIFVFYKNLSTPKYIGVNNQRLSPCPWTPNCVNSDSNDPQHKIQSLPCNSEQCLSFIEEFLLKNYKAKVITKTPSYLYVVVTTPYLHFKDDLEFLISPDKKSISVRSSSRVGYSDLDMNRKRIENIRNFLTSTEPVQK